MSDMPTSRHIQIAVAERMHMFERMLDDDGDGDSFVQGCVAAFAWVLGISNIPLGHDEPIDEETIVLLGIEVKRRIADAVTDLELREMMAGEER